MHPSDHYGIELKFSNNDTQKQSQIPTDQDTSPKLVFKSALAIIAPSHVAADLIQPIRHKYDPQVNRWPPHFNLLYPFFEDIHDENHEDFAKVFTSLARFAPFKCDLERLGMFENNGVVFLEPSRSSAQNMKAIYDQLIGIFTADPKK